MSDNITVAVDAMGGDYAPDEIVKGAAAALSDERIKLILVGKESWIQELLTKESCDLSRIEIVNASEVIENDDVPTTAIRQKRDSSMLVGLGLVKAGRADAFVSAGNTGALLTGATVTIGRIIGIDRPALATLLPGENGRYFLLDSGANVDCKPQYLVQFAKMGTAYMESVLHISEPRVGLINIGAESEKGNELTKEAHALLRESGLNFVGNVEARNIPAGEADVLVCDGFVGNVVLKYSEGLSKALMGMIKRELMSSTVSKLGGMLSRSAFANVKKRFDYTEVGGAPFLGLKSLVVKAHGSSDARAIRAAVRQCVIFVENDVTANIRHRL